MFFTLKKCQSFLMSGSQLEHFSSYICSLFDYIEFW